MDLFLASLVILAGVVLGAWMKLAPSREERRLAALRLAAMQAGWRISRVTFEERQALGLPEDLFWYGQRFETGTVDVADGVAVRQRDGVWQWLSGAGPDLGNEGEPQGVHALRVRDGELQVAWDEREGVTPAALADWSRRRMRAPGLVSLSASAAGRPAS